MAGYLTKLTMAQFRSHAKAELALDGRPIAIWGANGAGKTNILEAVSLLSPGRGLRRAAAEDMARAGLGLGWKLTAEAAGHEIDSQWQPSGARSLRIDGKAAPQTALASLLRILWLVPAQDRLWIEGAEGRRRFFDRVTMSFFPEHAATSLTYEKAMRERNRLLKDGVDDGAWYAALEHQMAETGMGISQARLHALARLTEAQRQGETAFPAADLKLEEVAPELTTPEALRTALADTRARDIAAGRTLIGPHRSDVGAIYADKQMPAAQCSTGEQKALLISLVLANARALKSETGAPPVLLLDEVTAHLDADRRAALFDEIERLGSQAWMTGTGPELFAEMGARAQRFEVTEAAGISSVNPV